MRSREPGPLEDPQAANAQKGGVAAPSVYFVIVYVSSQQSISLPPGSSYA